MSRIATLVARHINNAFKEEKLEKESNMHYLHNTQYKYHPTKIYDLNTIINHTNKKPSPGGEGFLLV